MQILYGVYGVWKWKDFIGIIDKTDSGLSQMPIVGAPRWGAREQHIGAAYGKYVTKFVNTETASTDLAK